MHIPKRLYMAKYVLWYLVYSIAINDLLFELPPWVYEHIFQAKLAYHPVAAIFLHLFGLLLAAGLAGWTFAGAYKRKPDVIDARILSILSVVITFSVAAVYYYLAMKLYGSAGVNEVALQKYVSKPATITFPSAFTRIFFLLIQYWLIGLSFVKGAEFYLLYQTRNKGKEAS